MRYFIFASFSLFLLSNCNSFKEKKIKVEEPFLEEPFRCPDYSDSIYNRIEILEQIGDTLDLIYSHCFPTSKLIDSMVVKDSILDNSNNENWIEIFDFVDTLNGNIGRATKVKEYRSCLQLYDNHIYQIYDVDCACVMIFFALHDGELFTFVDDTIQGHNMHGYYAVENYNHTSKLNKLLNWMDESPYEYLEEEYERVRNFEKYRVRRGFK